MGISFDEQRERLDREDLILAENYLKNYEKISISFLLFGNRQICKQTISNLMKLCSREDSTSQELYQYSCIVSDPDWKIAVLEALVLIQANRVISTLGFALPEVEEKLLSRIFITSIKIHPILKALYKLCEELTPGEARLLMVATTHENKLFSLHNASYLEIFILDLIRKGIIQIGDIERNIKPNLDIILKYLQLYGYPVLHNLLLTAINEFNKNVSVDKLNTNDSLLVLPRISCEIANIYRILPDRAGILLIINNINFTREEDPRLQDWLPERTLYTRSRTEIDEQSLKDAFEKYGYKAVIKRNLKHDEIISTVKKYVEISARYDSFIVCLMSHGSEGVMYGSNSIPVELEEIQKELTSDSLLDKLKILLGQMCQGEDAVTAKPIKSNLENDGHIQMCQEKDALIAKLTKSNLDTDRHIPMGQGKDVLIAKPIKPNLKNVGYCDSASGFSDMIVAMATICGKASFRHMKEGSWFIQSLCKHIDLYGDRNHFTDVLTLSSNEVQKKRTSRNECMVPVHSSTSGKFFYLPRKD